MLVIRGTRSMTKKARSKNAGGDIDSANWDSASGLDTNLAIIKLLQEDGRMSYAQIAKHLGLTEGAVRKRVIHLLDNQVISIIAEADPRAFGYNFPASVSITPAPGAKVDDLAQYLCGLSEVTYVVHYAGEYNLAIDIYVKSPEQLHEFLKEHIYSNPDIASCKPMIKLKVYKMRPKWHDLMNSKTD